ncbi:MAG: Na+/H+ antiporter [Burkholderiales bacterium]
MVNLIIALMLCGVGLAWLALRLRIPYPIALTLGGIALGFAPGLPKLPLDPNLILVIFLPPILYPAALLTSWRDFSRAIRPISFLAIGLVITTTLLVGIALKFLVPDIPWAVAFTFGAIISPPDAVAATAILGRMKLSRRTVTILEGESLVNDATGLVLYKFAVAAALSGAFSPIAATGQFIGVALGGIIIGAAIGYLFVVLHRQLHDALIEIMLSLTLPYTAYLLAETLHVSGVLAVVAAGLLRARHAPEVFSAETRLLGRSVWNLIVFVLNCVIFIMIGLQLPSILSALGHYSWQDLLWWGCAISIVAMAIRMVWVFPSAYIPRLLSKRIRNREDRPPWQLVTLIGWCGMRGIVSLAAALALPVAGADSTAFPYRDLIIFLTFCTIVATLVLQGLTMPPLIRWLKIGGDWRTYDEERKARAQIAQAALRTFDEYTQEHSIPHTSVERLREEYQQRLESLHPTRLLQTTQQDTLHHLRLVLIGAQRKELIKQWKLQKIGDETLHEIEHELDLEEQRLRH